MLQSSVPNLGERAGPWVVDERSRHPSGRNGAGQPDVGQRGGGTGGEMRIRHDVPVADPLADALVAQPGLLLEDVRGDDADGVRERVLDEVRAAWRGEADEVTATDELDFAGGPSPRKAPSPEPESPEGIRSEREVRHRFDCDFAERHPRRLIIHRDRRRGRPRKQGGSDPPS